MPHLIDPAYLSFPLRIGARGAATSGRRDHVRQQIEQVLFTDPGERVYRPEFGAGIRALIFEPNGSVLADILRNEPDGFKITGRSNRKAGFDDIHTKLVKLPCNNELLIRCERYTRSLFAVTKSCVKNADFFTNKRSYVVEDDSPQRLFVP